MRIDLHIHSVYSDGSCTPEQIAARIKALNISGFALTDHDSADGWKRARKAANELNLIFIQGKEIVIREKGKKFGEILALFLDEDIKIKRNDQNLSNIAEIIDQIHEKNGMAVIPHPFSETLRVQKIFGYIDKHRIKYDAIESINGRCNGKENATSLEYAIKRKIPQVGGSDAHILNEIGSVYTFCEAEDIEDFRKKIKRGLGKPIGRQKTEIEININRIAGRIIRIFK
ncbi:MAG: PHP domain-containing protein [Candidatus Micrarchaeota archaeon]|nr:PHP domain-containing protein [Candidatus Micrarchaeota archaeon]